MLWGISKRGRRKKKWNMLVSFDGLHWPSIQGSKLNYVALSVRRWLETSWNFWVSNSLWKQVNRTDAVFQKHSTIARTQKGYNCCYCWCRFLLRIYHCPPLLGIWGSQIVEWVEGWKTWRGRWEKEQEEKCCIKVKILHWKSKVREWETKRRKDGNKI